MKKIKIKTVKIESSVRKIRDEIVSQRTSSELIQKDQKKFDSWIEQLNSILNQITKIDEIVVPLMKKDLNYSFRKKNLIVTALVQPSLKNTFYEIKIHFINDSSFECFHEILDKLENSPDIAKSLAWIGDAAIKYAVSSKIWRIDTLTEELNDARKKYESNENLAKLCDEWRLFNHRINFDPENSKPKSANEIKGTLVESIFGVIFIEKGIDGVMAALHLIDKTLS